MALVALPSVFSFPVPARGTATPAVGTTAAITLDAAGEYTAVIFMARQAMTISHVGFHVTTATGSPTADVRIETVAADGMPSGTLWAANTNLVTGALSTGWGLHALTASASVTAGQMVCVKVLYNSGTTLALSRVNNLVWGGSEGNPYAVLNTGTPTKTALLSYCLLMAIGSSATSFYGLRSVIMPGSAITNTAYANATGERRGVRFQVPFPCRCCGMLDWNSASVGDFDISLYDDAGTLLESAAVDGDHAVNTSVGTQNLFFDTPVTLAANTWYRAVKTPTSATNDTISVLTLPSADYMGGFGWGNGKAHYTTFTTAGGWVDSATDQIPLFMRPLMDQLDDGAGGGTTGGGHILGGTVVR